jgi:hypothetical protein
VNRTIRIVIAALAVATSVTQLVRVLRSSE